MVQIIELVDRKCPLDLVFIDYLTLMNVGDSRHPTETIHATIKEVKDFCLSFHGGKGLTVLTPVQGSRRGYDAAAGVGGTWTKDGIYMFSEFERSLDTLLYVFADTELKELNLLKVGTCKTRRSLDVDATLVKRNAVSGLIVDANGWETPPKDLEVASGERWQEGWVY